MDFSQFVSIIIKFMKVFFKTFVSKEAQKYILYHCHHFEQYSAARPHFCGVIPLKRFCPNDFRQAFKLLLWIKASLKPYSFEPNMLQTPKMITVEIVKWIITSKKYINFCRPCEGC